MFQNNYWRITSSLLLFATAKGNTDVLDCPNASMPRIWGGDSPGYRWGKKPYTRKQLTEWTDTDVSEVGHIATAGYSVSGNAALKFYEEPSDKLLMSPLVALYPHDAQDGRVSALDSALVVQLRMPLGEDGRAHAVAF
jgi:hypothetical protein